MSVSVGVQAQHLRMCTSTIVSWYLGDQASLCVRWSVSVSVSVSVTPRQQHTHAFTHARTHARTRTCTQHNVRTHTTARAQGVSGADGKHPTKSYVAHAQP